MPVIPAAWEAEAEEPLEPGAQETEVAVSWDGTPLHSSLGNRARLHLKQNKTKKNVTLVAETFKRMTQSVLSWN